jgi:hypothetical protein
VGPEIVIALQALRGAWAGIQFCCESLREGTVEVQRVKKEVTQAVDTVKTAYKEITGLWSWLKSLFGSKPNNTAYASTQSAPQAVTQQAAPGKKKKGDEYVTHVPTEDEVVQQFIGHLGTWFDNYATLKAFTEKRYTEVFGKDVINQKDVLELTQLQAEVDAAYPALMTLMTTNAPWQLGPIWSKFKEMQDKVAAGQAARQMREKRERAKRKAAAAQARSDRIDLNMTLFYTGILVFYFWLFMGLVWESAKTMP